MGNELISEIIVGLENFCSQFNFFIIIIFQYLKYIFGIILVIIGILTLVRMRGVYKVHRATSYYEKKAMIVPKVIVGLLYVSIGYGMFFDYMIYVLIHALDFLPDRFIFSFFNFAGVIDPSLMNRIEDIETSKYPHERTIYYLVAFGSFMSLLTIVLCLYKIINKEGSRIIDATFKTLVFAIIDGLLMGFTTCLPLFL